MSDPDKHTGPDTRTVAPARQDDDVTADAQGAATDDRGSASEVEAPETDDAPDEHLVEKVAAEAHITPGPEQFA